MRGARLLPALIAAACGDARPLDADAGPRRLGDTALYRDIADKTIASDALEFAPAYVLWSDGAQKRRWVRIPRGKKIDTSDMDRWRLPVGTQFYKEFSRDGKRLETRLIERVADTGDDRADYWMGAFVWTDDEADAVFVAEGAENVRGTDHDVPSADLCWRCHLGEPGHALGFSALQLSHDGPGLTLAQLEDDGRLSAPTGREYRLSGGPVQDAALGYLHANCGHCHNPSGGAWSSTSQVLRLGIADADLAMPAVVASIVGVPLQSWLGHGYTVRVVPGDPDASALYFRMTVRNPDPGMPPLATEIPDDAGLAAVRAWISSL